MNDHQVVLYFPGAKERWLMMKWRLASWLQRFALLRWVLRLGVQLFVPRQHVGAVGAVFNQAGQVLLVEHVFRPNFPWGLPGGWIGRGEDPAKAVEREFREELGLQVNAEQLLICEPQGGRTGVPRGLGLAYYCRLVSNGTTGIDLARASMTYEVLSVKWVDPGKIEWKLTAIDRKAIELAKQAYVRDRVAATGD
jgi:ADP-ribose pyrophosphatase YjhB (NUDIX family)